MFTHLHQDSDIQVSFPHWTSPLQLCGTPLPKNEIDATINTKIHSGSLPPCHVRSQSQRLFKRTGTHRSLVYDDMEVNSGLTAWRQLIAVGVFSVDNGMEACTLWAVYVSYLTA